MSSPSHARDPRDLSPILYLTDTVESPQPGNSSRLLPMASERWQFILSLRTLRVHAMQSALGCTSLSVFTNQSQPLWDLRLHGEPLSSSTLSLHREAVPLWYNYLSYHSITIYMLAPPDCKLLTKIIHALTIFVNSTYYTHNKHSINIYWVNYALRVEIVYN